jgi:O-methyltransferase domain
VAFIQIQLYTNAMTMKSVILVVTAVIRKALDNRLTRNIINRPDKSSISDDFVFPLTCQLYSKSNFLFNNFRRNTIIQTILEHTNYDQGLCYIKRILELGFDHNYIKEFTTSDTIGNPIKYEYPQIGFANPSTLRYVFVLSDLTRKFGSLDNFRIIEIGGGYGGQARIIMNRYRVAQYSIYDLPSVLEIANRFLRKSLVLEGIYFKNALTLNSDESDLIISNYAWSELNKSAQNEYLNKIVLNSKNGYITYNQINPDSFNSFTINELINLIPELRIEDENPLTWPGNKVLTFLA